LTTPAGRHILFYIKENELIHLKRSISVSILFFIIISVFGQESAEIQLIQEQSRSVNREQKLAALQRIGALIRQGNTSDELYGVLEYLANEETERGKVINGIEVHLPLFQDVRARAVSYLGALGTSRAKDVICEVILKDYYSESLIEAINGLEKMGIDRPTLDIINLAFTQYTKVYQDNDGPRVATYDANPAIILLRLYNHLIDRTNDLLLPQDEEVLNLVREKYPTTPAYQQTADRILTKFRTKLSQP
jgi:hypothetical protein